MTSISNLKAIRHLHPSVRIENQQYLLMNNLLTSINTQELHHEPVMNADMHRVDVLAALDLLVMGI